MLSSLTSLRFFAAMMVVAHHLPGSPFFFAEGYTGVTFFFVLSGFILSVRYASGFRDGTVTARAFWSARIARIYPLHLLTLAAAAPIAWHWAPWWEFCQKLAAQLTLTHAAIPLRSFFFSFDEPSWSLSVEAFFYLLFPLLAAASARSLVLLLASVLCYHGFITAAGGESAHFLGYIFPVARLGDFVAGILLFRFFRSRPQLRAGAATSVQGAALALLIICYASAAKAPQVLRYDIYYLPAMAAVVLAFAYQRGLLARAASRPALVLLGDASFALYLLQWLVISYGKMVRPIGISEAAAAAVYVAVTVGLSVLVHKLYELPAKAFTLRLLRGFAASGSPRITDRQSMVNSG